MKLLEIHIACPWVIPLNYNNWLLFDKHPWVRPCRNAIDHSSAVSVAVFD